MHGPASPPFGSACFDCSSLLLAPAEAAVQQEAPLAGLSRLAGLADAAAGAAAGGNHAGVGPPPLLACVASLQPAAQRIVRAAQTNWLSADMLHQLMTEHAALGVPLTTQQPRMPQGEQ